MMIEHNGGSYLKVSFLCSKNCLIVKFFTPETKQLALSIMRSLFYLSDEFIEESQSFDLKTSQNLVSQEKSFSPVRQIVSKLIKLTLKQVSFLMVLEQDYFSTALRYSMKVLYGDVLIFLPFLQPLVPHSVGDQFFSHSIHKKCPQCRSTAKLTITSRTRRTSQTYWLTFFRYIAFGIDPLPNHLGNQLIPTHLFQNTLKLWTKNMIYSQSQLQHFLQILKYFLQQQNMGLSDSCCSCIPPIYRWLQYLFLNSVQTSKEFATALRIANYGNTCYLNTVLQLLFSMEDVVREIGSINRTGLPYHTAIMNIYHSILNLQSQQQNIHNLLRTIQQRNRHIQPYEQNDALNILNIILKGLQDENSKLSSLFTVKASYTCKNCKDVSLRSEEVFQCPKYICHKCNKQMLCTISYAPAYLIIVTKLSKEPFCERLQYRDQTGKKIEYHCISLAKYRGNGQRGHYTALRQFQQSGRTEWIEINDHRCRQVPRSQLSQIKPMLSVYKKVKEVKLFKTPELND